MTPSHYYSHWIGFFLKNSWHDFISFSIVFYMVLKIGWVGPLVDHGFGPVWLIRSKIGWIGIWSVKPTVRSVNWTNRSVLSELDGSINFYFLRHQNDAHFGGYKSNLPNPSSVRTATVVAGSSPTRHNTHVGTAPIGGLEALQNLPPSVVIALPLPHHVVANAPTTVNPSGRLYTPSGRAPKPGCKIPTSPLFSSPKIP